MVVLSSPTPQPGACLHLPGLWGASTVTGFWFELQLEFVHVQNWLQAGLPNLAIVRTEVDEPLL